MYLVGDKSLNAPYGARCFLTDPANDTTMDPWVCLNAPYGARCFLTDDDTRMTKTKLIQVLMHLMALGAF